MCLEGCELKGMSWLFTIEMLIYSSKAKSDMTILFGKITHRYDPNITKTSTRGQMKHKFYTPFCFMIYLLVKLNSISETDNCIEYKFQCQLNHGPE